jgi:SAM-dependent methyltransferase
MKTSDEIDFLAVERQRIQLEYQRRAREIQPDFYSPWQPGEILFRNGRKGVAARMLHEAQVFPRAGDKCLEVGCGTVGWLPDLISWGVSESDLHGIDINPLRITEAQQILPVADLRVGDGTSLPWESDLFRLVISATVFTSILDKSVRHVVASEIIRVLAPGGALLWHDFAFDNPQNGSVRGINRTELRNLFPTLTGKIRSATLAPPLARLIAPRSWTLATFLEAIPLLRTHLLAVLIKS